MSAPYVNSTVGGMLALKQLSLADCNLTNSIPNALFSDTTTSTTTTVSSSLQSLTLYGNPRLTSVPAALVVQCVNLQYLWLEGTAVHKGPDLNELIHAVVERQQSNNNNNADVDGCFTTDGSPPAADERRHFKALGLDTDQFDSITNSSLRQAALPYLSIGQVRNRDQHGYFKLESNSNNNRVLVVSFGSAPGVPNWGGLLKKVRATATTPIEAAWDILYVVDPHRSWYGGGDDDYEEEEEGSTSDNNDASVSHSSSNNYKNYYERLAKVTSEYDKVLMMGDSMGATASLLFSLATRVLAFCPQIELTTASIRPACSTEWFDRLKSRLLHNVEHNSQATIHVHVGNWKHDLDQVRDVGKKKGRKGVGVKIWGVNSHRLAAVLDKREKLVPLVRSAVMEELGCENAGEVRLVNLV